MEGELRMTDPEREEAVNFICREIESLRFLMKLLLGVVFLSLAVISAATIIAANSSADSKRAADAAESAGKSNNQFLSNFSNYMRCLVVNDDEVVIALGEEAYFNLCDDLLFRGTGETPDRVVVTIPSTTTTTSP